MFRSPLSLDKPNVLSTAVAGLLVLAVVIVTQKTAPEWAAMLSWGLVLALAVSFMLAPRELVVDGGEMRIHRRFFPPLRFELADIESAAPLDAAGTKVIRLFGVGGFFGSYGLFSSDKLGRFRAYLTRSGQAVLVKRKNGLLPIVLTPDDVEGAIHALDPRDPGSSS